MIQTNQTDFLFFPPQLQKMLHSGQMCKKSTPCQLTDGTQLWTCKMMLYAGQAFWGNSVIENLPHNMLFNRRPEWISRSLILLCPSDYIFKIVGEIEKETISVWHASQLQGGSQTSGRLHTAERHSAINSLIQAPESCSILLTPSDLMKSKGAIFWARSVWSSRYASAATGRSLLGSSSILQNIMNTWSDHRKYKHLLLQYSWQSIFGNIIKANWVTKRRHFGYIVLLTWSEAELLQSVRHGLTLLIARHFCVSVGGYHTAWAWRHWLTWSTTAAGASSDRFRDAEICS